MRVTITLPDDDLKKVDELANQLLIPRSALIRIAVVEYIRRQRRLS